MNAMEIHLEFGCWFLQNKALSSLTNVMAFFFLLQVLIGVKFISQWPFISRLRVCFAEPPYFQMTVKPIFTHGLDVTELPGIAGWLVINQRFIFMPAGFWKSYFLSFYLYP